jgi:hypothetical protein
VDEADVGTPALVVDDGVEFGAAPNVVCRLSQFVVLRRLLASEFAGYLISRDRTP